MRRLSGRRIEWLGSIVLLATLGIAHGAHTASVYKCRDGAGHVAYQDHACAGAQQESQIELAQAPAPAKSPEYRVATDTKPARAVATRGSRRSGARATEAMSYECRADNGEVFYRHSACPKSIPVDASHGAAPRRGHGKSQRGKTSAAVSAVSLPRSEVCKRLAAGGSIGRAGHARDERVSTYERNAGRDPCRRS
ncbi:DUF4124 domain-containing protein [Dokdonella soli]|uniref:DUF4124 domain-containing protein n=1 Tax=Dokdonella soli TaxID=529810 RepID=A0ABP3TUL9_9GAMM